MMGRALVQVVELDGETGRPEVLLSQYSGGAHCCTMITIFRENDEGKLQAIEVDSWFDGDIFAATEPVPGYGYMPDHSDSRFLYHFGAGYVASNPPPRFLALQEDRIVDVGDRPYLRSIFEEFAQRTVQRLPGPPPGRQMVC